MTKVRARTIDKELRGVQKNIALNEIRAGELLKIIKDEDLWLHLGYVDFDDYTDRVCGYKEGAAQRRITIAARLAEHKIKVDPAQILPISKLYEVARISRTSAQFEKWAKKGRKKTLAALQKEVDLELVRRGEKTAKEIRNREIRMGFAFTPTGAQDVKRAAKLAVKLGYAKTASEFIVKTARQYAEKNKNRKPKANLKLAA
jgi:hypothetical protein